MRENPRLGVVKSVLRTYIDVLHYEKNQKERIFAGTGALEDHDQRTLLDTGMASPRSETYSQARHLQPSKAFQAEISSESPQKLFNFHYQKRYQQDQFIRKMHNFRADLGNVPAIRLDPEMIYGLLSNIIIIGSVENRNN